MEELVNFRQTLIAFQDPGNGKRDMRRKNGAEGPGPLHIAASSELHTRLLKLQVETKLSLISEDELLIIQQLWKSARKPDDGGGVARIVTRQRGIMMSADLKELNRLREMEDAVAREKSINPDILRRRLAKVEEYSESHRAHGLPDDLLNILKDDIADQIADKGA